MKVANYQVETLLSVNFGEDPLTLSIPPLASDCKDLRIEATLDGQPIEEFYSPYVQLYSDEMILTVNAVDCLVSLD
jgi:hypothetical protein